MSKTSVIGRPAGDEEIGALAKIMALAFGIAAGDARTWLDKTGHEKLRIARIGNEVAGGIIILPMGQWFGGRAVSMGGIAAVAVAPQYRARGIASQMMSAAVREMHADGLALSVLYPATVPLYRRAGYELGGSVHQISLPARDLVERDRRLRMREITPADTAAVRRAYRKRARRTSGNLERGDYFWRRIREPFGAPAVHGYAVWRGNEIEGYVYFFQKRSDTEHYTLKVTDLVVLTPEAGRRLLTFFADHRTMAEAVVWYGTPADPLLMVLTEHTHKIRLAAQWMQRIVSVERALSGRGYPKGVETSIHFQVRDENLRANNGRFALQISGGRGTVRRGGRGSVKINIRALASLYTGHMSPRDLVAAGMLEATPGQLASLAPIFAGPAPWMPDMF